MSEEYNHTCQLFPLLRNCNFFDSYYKFIVVYVSLRFQLRHKHTVFFEIFFFSSIACFFIIHFQQIYSQFMMRTLLFYLFMGFLPYFTFGQSLSLTKAPQDAQIYQRNVSTNRATVAIEGSVAMAVTNAYVQLQIRVSNEQALVNTVTLPLSYIAGKADFSTTVQIPAVRSNHRLEFYGLRPDNNQWILEKTIQKVLAGDIYIINGQSNAIAGASPMLEDVDEYTRSHTNIYGWGTLNNSFPGQWGARLAKRITIEQNIPVAIFNVAIGAEKLATYLKNTSDPYAGNYGGMLKRFEDAGLEKKARAAFWFQGEADSWEASVASYMSDFNLLNNAWKADLNIEKTFLYQMRYQSCSSPFAFVLEAQRRLGNTPGNNIEVMSSTNADHDFCHFSYINGYQTLGDRMYELVANRLYGKQNSNFQAPNISEALVSGTNELTLKFPNTVGLQAIGNPWNAFTVKTKTGTTLGVTSGTVSGNNILLSLNVEASNIDSVSYLAPPGVISPCMTNTAGVGVLMFRSFPVTGGTVTPPPPPPPTPTPNTGLDLELSCSTTTPSPAVYSSFKVRYVLYNKGTLAGTDIKVNFVLPTSLKYVGGSEAVVSSGSFDPYIHRWSIPSVAVGDSAVIVLNIYNRTSSAKVVYGQVTACAQTDSDSQPNNGTPPSLNQDDETAIGINGGVVPGGGGSGGGGVVPPPPPPPSNQKADLELVLTSSKPQPGQWAPVDFLLVLTNKGTVAATNIKIDFMKQSNPAIFSQLAYVNHQASAFTQFDTWLGIWSIPSLAPNQSVNITYNSFTKVATIIDVFAQVAAQSESDLDSAPGNNTTGVPAEDDETRIRLNANANLFGNAAQSDENVAETNRNTLLIYPNPAEDHTTIQLHDYMGEVVQLQVRDERGNLVLDEKTGVLQVPYYSLPLTGLDNGKYFLSVLGAGKRTKTGVLLVVKSY